MKKLKTFESFLLEDKKDKVKDKKEKCTECGKKKCVCKKGDDKDEDDKKDK